jgi:uncharacterized protein
MLELSMRQARRLMIGSQLLSGPVPKRPTKQAMLSTIRHLGAVQIDSISVVQRSHHLVLWSRLGNHPSEWLDQLLGDDKEIFEYWVHAAAYAAVDHFPFFRRQMLAFPEMATTRTREWMDENRELLDHVMAHVRQHGPVTTKTFAAPDGAQRAEAWAWYGNKPTNLALEILWSTGDLMIDRRLKFQRVYDLTERVLPDWDDDHLPPVDAERRALGLLALNALGVTTPAWISDYFRTHSTRPAIPRKDIPNVMEELVDIGQAVRGSVEGLAHPVYISTQALGRNFKPSRTTLLSSFDSLVWDRKRTLEMFDFFLQLEAYTPRQKRVYGYFSLPILYRDRLVGRLDPKAHRATGELSIRSFHLEPWFLGKDDERFYAQLAETLLDFSAFNGTDHITVHSCNPPESRSRLLAAIGAAGA